MQTTIPTGRDHSGGSLLARLDRIPTWPYPTSLLWIIGAGYFFAFFDITNIGYALPVIADRFGVSDGVASWAVTASLFAYIVGALLDGTISDVWGRKVSLTLSVAFFSLGSIGAAASPTLGWLIASRVVAGMGIGAEIASVTTYLGEVSPAPVRGRYTSWATTFAYAGFAAVPFVARALVPTVVWGWRAMFAIGAVGGLTILFLRRGLHETPRWLITHDRRREAEAVIVAAERSARAKLGHDLPAVPAASDEPPSTGRLPLTALFQQPYLGRVLLFVAVWFVYYVGNYGWLEMAPTLLHRLGYSVTDSLGYLVVSGIGFLAGAAATVTFTDRFERKYATALIALVWSASLIVIGVFPTPSVVMIGGFVASTTIGLLVPIMYTLTAEQFTTIARASGVATTDGIGHLGGAIAPQIVLWAAALWGFTGGLAIMAVSGVVTAALLPLAISTTGQPLESATT